ncbi:MAG: hypothetical protein JNM12_09970 [Alphaproteobacteria bacterium]|nr:hypothetical protein [Alphaproteobacteria bacterium]
MTVIAVEFPRARPLPNQTATIYQIKWATESETIMFKSTTDANSVRRQLESCRKRGLLAIVTAFIEGASDRGIPCGSVVGYRQRDESFIFSAHFEEIGRPV